MTIKINYILVFFRLIFHDGFHKTVEQILTDDNTCVVLRYDLTMNFIHHGQENVETVNVHIWLA